MSDAAVTYRYRTFNDGRGYVAQVERHKPDAPTLVTSYQTGFRDRHAAYRYARSMATTQARIHSRIRPCVAVSAN
jgi:hypothetical protein